MKSSSGNAAFATKKWFARTDYVPALQNELLKKDAVASFMNLFGGLCLCKAVVKTRHP